MHQQEGYEADHYPEDSQFEMAEYAPEQESEVSVESIGIHEPQWEDIPVVPVHHAHPRGKPGKEEKTEEKPTEGAADEKEEVTRTKEAKKESK